MRVLSGVKPSGRPHLGNYLGAMRQHIALQEEGHECFFFVADLHALTTLRDAEQMKSYRREIVLDYLALGLDPEKITFFYQSDVPEHSELFWILSTVTPPGLLERAHAWKDAKEKKERDVNAGLFVYPVLMAADILLYDTEIVPVGKDQKQHVEIARDIAISFNHHFGETFRLPEERIEEDVATIRGTDGRKMSKSYNNTIGLFEEEATLKKQVMSIQTQSLNLEDPMPTQEDLVLELYREFASPDQVKKLEENYQAGGFGYGRAKQALLECLLESFHSARQKREKLLKSSFVEEVMAEGKKKALMEAQKTLERVKQRIGFL